MKRWALGLLAAAGTAGLIALGVWQLERRVWKLALIERVEQRVHAPPSALPGPSQWAALNKENAEYRRVGMTGRFLPGRETLVRAVTELGGGFWVMAPFKTDEGFIVLVNRGFVAPEQRDPATRAKDPGVTDEVSLTGLVRMTEPGGGFLRANAPAEDRWYSRDVAAISHAQNLSGIAPYFVDVEATPATPPGAASVTAPTATPASNAPAGQPVAGLTVISFHNSHLLYALTWFTLALMVAALGVRMARPEPRPR